MKQATAIFPLLFASALLIVSTQIATSASFSIFGTGVDNNGSPLSRGATDPHYSVSGATNTTQVIDFTGANFNHPLVVPGDPFWDCGGVGIPCSWASNGPNSQWIGVAGSLFGIPEATTLTFATTFDLTGFVPSTASIQGVWAIDNEGLEVRLNGIVLTGVNLLGDININFEQLHPLSVTTGFISGLNTLEFVVRNNQVVGGFRAELHGTADVLETPLPTTLPLFASGLALLWWGTCRRRIQRQRRSGIQRHPVGRNSEAYCAVLVNGGLRFANPPYNAVYPHHEPGLWIPGPLAFARVPE